MVHLHNIVDHDKHFVIDPITRKIAPEIPQKRELVQYDHNSERFTFEIPRYVEGHDMSLSDIVQIHYTNVSNNKTEANADVYAVDDLGVMADKDDTVVFSWLISQNATKLVGTLHFAIRFICSNGEFSDYIWNTKIHSSILISKSIDSSPAVIENYSDVLNDIADAVREKSGSDKQYAWYELADAIRNLPATSEGSSNTTNQNIKTL